MRYFSFFFILILINSCSNKLTDSSIYNENINYAYLSSNKGVDILDTHTLRRIYRLNDGENSGNTGIINFGKNVIINNLDKKVLDIYSITQKNFVKIDEIKLDAPIIDIAYKNDEAYLIFEKHYLFNYKI